MKKIMTIPAIAALALAAPLLTACTTDGNASSASEATHSATNSDQTVTLADGWAKAGDQGGMTGVFGTLENHGSDDLTITEVTSDAAGMIELHEVVGGEMRAIEDQVVIAAGSSYALEPGANHVMLMDLNHDLLPGDEVAFTLSFDDGSAQEFVVIVKDYAGAQEDYAPGEDHDAHGDHDHDETGHDDTEH